MEVKDLSKQKYIYKTYKNHLGELHCEKYPVIYANKEYVYYKASDVVLEHTGTSYIHDHMTEDDKYLHNTHYWNVDMSILEIQKRKMILNEAKEQLHRLRLERDSLEVTLKKASEAYNQMAEAVKKLEAEHEESKLL